MERQLPKISLSGDLFWVNLEKGGLQDSKRPDYVIPFAEMARDKGPIGLVYRFGYDQNTRQQYNLNIHKGVLPDSIILLEILPESFLDPYGVALKLGVPERNLPKNDKEAYHRAREIPKVGIGVTDFFVDTVHMVLRQAEDMGKTISFDHFWVDKKWPDKMFFAYDLSTKSGIERKQLKTNPNGITVQMTIIDKLDPLGIRTAHGDRYAYSSVLTLSQVIKLIPAKFKFKSAGSNKNNRKPS